ncbi:E3 ubiquitin-protein ligase MARCHF5-like [Adelges cooleyi]|uniref:E3 ubiquitin-protein ligase MARCHF5-like n=1 Tax=Adelges cooleyi TaxID=133065 RepID=UPI00218050CE|nr:E3 ubiquitin-protein ligase MARCHF5-like [Adelges cooleyi]
MANLNTTINPSTYKQESSKQKFCWVCFETDDDEFEGRRDWVSPCKCRGSTRWVHQDCVQCWVAKKLKENSTIKVHCPLCKTEYNIIIMYEVNFIVKSLNELDKISNQLSPFLIFGVAVDACYLTAALYGAITIIQVIGKEEAMIILKDTDPSLLLLMLPAIPLSLIMSRTINWEETLLLAIQRFTFNFPILRNIMPSILCEPVNMVNTTHSVQFNSRTYVALLLPTTAKIVGNVLFHYSSYSNIQKTLLGGLVFIAVKGALTIYQRQHNAIRNRTRKVADYPDSAR